MRVATALSESGRDGKAGVVLSMEVGVAVVVEVGTAAITMSVRTMIELASTIRT